MTKSKTYGAGARRRTQERVHRLAYDFEAMAKRAREGGAKRLADHLADLASKCGNMARNNELWVP